ncbi:MAG: hypothetical protein K6F09_01935 [Clostridiales bacterium]|nr:hypothetical protein [Clostridiales bacterium]
MKKAFLIILAAALCMSFVSCTKTEKTISEPASVSDKTESEITSEDAEIESSTENSEAALVSETETKNAEQDETYINAVKTAYDKIKVDAEEEEIYGTPSAYMTDLNGDGYKDIIYQSRWFPGVLIYDNGEFVDSGISEENVEVLGGSIFPSGKESGFFIDSKQGIIVVRYDAHTVGTIAYRGAQAFKITDNKATGLWTEYYDEESFYDKDQSDGSDVDWDRVTDMINKEYDEKQYLPRIKDYDLVNYYDVSVPWDGSVL